MNLILLKWFRQQKYIQKRHTMRQKQVEAKEVNVYKSVFIYLNLY